MISKPSAPPSAAPPARSVSVVIPALNEAARIAEVVAYALADPATAEVIVVDDSSIDATAELARTAGARVITSSMLGKGASMHDGCLAAEQEVLVYLDGDLTGLQPGIVTALATPVLSGCADFVKARFGRGGGRVTELTAKPMLKVFFPELAEFAQPLGGLIAARRSLLRSLSFEDGYGVDIGLLIDAHRVGGRLVEVDIGRIEHDSQPLLDLSLMATEVARVIFARARAAGRLHVEQITAMYESQRQAAGSIDYILTRRRGRSRLLLLDMDGTVSEQRFVMALAQATGRERELAALLDQPGDDAVTRSAAIAALFRFVTRQQFEQVARALPLRPGAIEWVNQMRRAGFMVGLVSDSWFVAADVVRRRLFADFALAHVLQFDGEVCNGQLNINPAFRAPLGSNGPALCKSHVLTRFREEPSEPRITEIWAMGDNLNDLEMLRAADRAFVIDPKHPHLARDADALKVDSFLALAHRALDAEPAA
ncbi:glycosyltransferase [Inhella gelatinilytica]|uniref:Glycosyltransferase n=1 Tax=Inhella gelatinilytica TaxID=2795030 RepID=A0A931NBK3_9BURK|nr:glycosyltransferase [Inhella gelatinilytica]MBH9553668.1 glycosyltransferase [Inhella gelatinilytica]